MKSLERLKAIDLRTTTVASTLSGDCAKSAMRKEQDHDDNNSAILDSPPQRHPEPSSSNPLAWMCTYRQSLLIADPAICLLCLTVGIMLRGLLTSSVTGSHQVSYAIFVPIAAVVWITVPAWRAYRSKIVGVDLEEYRRVTIATLIFFGGLAIASYSSLCN